MIHDCSRKMSSHGLLYDCLRLTQWWGGGRRKTIKGQALAWHAPKTDTGRGWSPENILKAAKKLDWHTGINHGSTWAGAERQTEDTPDGTPRVGCKIQAGMVYIEYHKLVKLVAGASLATSTNTPLLKWQAFHPSLRNKRNMTSVNTPQADHPHWF